MKVSSFGATSGITLLWHRRPTSRQVIVLNIASGLMEKV
jgi:hypothetical protein